MSGSVHSESAEERHIARLRRGGLLAPDGDGIIRLDRLGEVPTLQDYQAASSYGQWTHVLTEEDLAVSGNLTSEVLAVLQMMPDGKATMLEFGAALGAKSVQHVVVIASAVLRLEEIGLFTRTPEGSFVIA